MRRSFAVTASVSVHLGQTVNIGIQVDQSVPLNAAAGKRHPAIALAASAAYQTTPDRPPPLPPPATARIPASSTRPPARHQRRQLPAPAIISTSLRILASSTSQSRGSSRRALAQLQPVGHAVVGGVLARGEQRLRVDVERVGAARAELERRDRQHARAAAVVDDLQARAAPRRRAIRRHSAVEAWVPVPKARPGSSRTTTASALCDRLVPRADPQPAPEAHGVEVAQPFALPDPIGHRARPQSQRLDPERGAPASRSVRAPASLGAEQRLQPGLRPQAHLARAAARAPRRGVGSLPPRRAHH